LGTSKFYDKRKHSIVAKTIYQDLIDKKSYKNFSNLIKSFDLNEAYKIQDAFLNCMNLGGYGKISGWKMALTSVVMQKMVGCSSPCYGAILSKNVLDSPAEIHLNNYINLGVETELAIRINADLKPLADPYTVSTIKPAVDSCMAAIEIIDDRKINYDNLDLQSLIAMNAFNSGVVLGPEIKVENLSNFTNLNGKMYINGLVKGKGNTSDTLGSPLNSLVWLANKLNEMGKYLKAADIIMTGSIAPTRWPKKGDTISSSFYGVEESVLKVI
tara:strand:- start:656 stop:1468 length:813 start_codon:yes stop_codon:yes gene_type:complete